MEAVGHNWMYALARALCPKTRQFQNPTVDKIYHINSLSKPYLLFKYCTFRQSTVLDKYILTKLVFGWPQEDMREKDYLLNRPWQKDGTTEHASRYLQAGINTHQSSCLVTVEEDQEVIGHSWHWYWSKYAPDWRSSMVDSTLPSLRSVQVN